MPECDQRTPKCSLPTLLRRLAPCLLLSPLLGGCAMGGLGSMFGGSGSSDQGGGLLAPSPMAVNSVENQGAVAAVNAGPQGECPRFQVWKSERELTFYKDGRIGDSLAIRHRGEIIKTARECAIDASNNVTVKYGVRGRVLLGPKGQDGAIKIPMVIKVADNTNQIIKTTKVNVPVKVNLDRPFNYFSLVNRIAFPTTPGARLTDYSVYVSFDSSAPGAG